MNQIFNNMAFTDKNPNKKSKDKYVVRQGVSGGILSTHKTKKEADDRVAKLHKKHNPSSSARGKNAKKSITKRLKSEGEKGLPRKRVSPKQPKGKKAGVHRNMKKK